MNGVHVRSIKIVNFLSFKHSVITFEPNGYITIVGPNYSGKSSIFEALRFGFGSNQKIRYNKWSEYLNDTICRPDQDEFVRGLVELEIFDGNKTSTYKREIMMNGKTSYFINDQAVSRADYMKKMEAIGVNPDNPFIFLPQGQMQDLKKLKPIQFREFMEEGLNLSASRQKIYEESDKLVNLELLLEESKSDRQVFEKELERLQKDLERLKRKRELIRKLEELEVEHLFSRREEYKRELKDLQAKMDEIQQDIDSITEKQKEILDKAIVLENEIKTREENVKKLEQDKADKMLEISKHEQSISTMEESSRELLTKKMNLKKEIAETCHWLDTNIEDKEGVEKRLNETLQELEKKKEQISSIRKERDKIKEDLSKAWQIQEQIQKEKNLLMEIETKLIKLQGEVENLEQQVSENRKATSELTEQMNKLDIGEGNSAHVRVEKGRRETKKRELEKKIRENEIEKERLTEKINALEKKLDAKRADIPNQILKLSELVEQRFPGTDKIMGPLISLIEFDPKFSNAVEGIFGRRRIFAFIAMDSMSFDVLKSLRLECRAPCSIYRPKSITPEDLPPLTDPEAIDYLIDVIKFPPRIKNVIYDIVRDTIIVKDWIAAKQLAEKIPNRLVTLEGEVLVQGKYAHQSPGYRPSRGQQVTLQALRNQRDTLRRDVERINEWLSKSYRKLNDYTEQIRIFDIQIQNIEKKRELMSKIHQLNGKLKELNAKILDRNRKIKNFENNKASTLARIDSLEKSIPDDHLKLREQFDDLNSKIQEIEQELDKINDKKRELEEARNNFTALMKRKFDAIKKCQEELSKIRKMKKDWDKKVREASKKIQALQREIERIKEKMESIEKEKDDFTREKEALTQEQFQVEVKLESLKSNKQELNQKYQETQQNLNNIDLIISERGHAPPKIIRPREKIEALMNNIHGKLGEYQNVDETIEEKLKNIEIQIQKNQEHEQQIMQEM
ncbi:MAG: AAA family ATPase, partial [Candidatus Helarchaeales archaeon]